MRVFVAGGTGAIGTLLVPLLVEAGHHVVGLARSGEKARALEAMGAESVVADALDSVELTQAIARSRPDVVLHQLTALSQMGSFRRFDEDLALTNRFRTDVLDAMMNAARAAGARRFIAQSFCGWPYAREGPSVKSEVDPLDPDPPSGFGKSLDAIRHLEDAVRAAHDLQALALRYGMFYGPGTAITRGGPIVELVRRRKMPIVGKGTGVWSFVHVLDAARATVHCVIRGEPGIYNIVDDEPASVSDWLPDLAEAIGAKPPRRVPEWLGRLAIGDGGVSMMTRVRGGSNAKAKRALGWQPRFSSWRQGFRQGLV